MRTSLALALAAAVLCAASLFASQHQNHGAVVGHKFSVVKTDAEWKKLLPPASYRILREKDTEPAYTGVFWDNHQAGTYYCAGCGLELFTSKTKFESHTGWPSFWAPVRLSAVLETTDRTYGMDRTEVLCSRCGGHLGHVFNDGPKPTGLRYCMNSGAMKFKPAKR